MPRTSLVVDQFAAQAKDLRSYFDAQFADPRSARGERFVWDYWHVPGQYTHLRTPAYHYFPKRLYDAFHQALVAWGRETLGCHDISPPWLSCYVEGCRQELHGDLPHGPFAFVFSLTPNQRVFRGGETLLMQDSVLDYWDDFISEQSIEEKELLRAIPPKFNRLTVFDPRIPHGVREVRGTHDPREGRLVIHGWFVQPRPFIKGPLPKRAIASCLTKITESLERFIQAGLSPVGVLTLRLGILESGAVRHAEALLDTTRVPAHLEPDRKRMVRAMVSVARRHVFPKSKGESVLTLPLVFERS